MRRDCICACSHNSTHGALPDLLRIGMAEQARDTKLLALLRSRKPVPWEPYVMYCFPSAETASWSLKAYTPLRELRSVSSTYGPILFQCICARMQHVTVSCFGKAGVRHSAQARHDVLFAIEVPSKSNLLQQGLRKDLSKP